MQPLESLVSTPENIRETLRHLHHHQRAELDYRRAREFQTFTWSATILLATIAGLLARDSGAPQLLRESFLWQNIGSATIVGLTIFSLLVQRHHRQAAAEHKQALVRIAERLGAYTPNALGASEQLYPDSWRDWGKKPQKVTLRSLTRNLGRLLATALLGLIAFLTICLT